MLQDTESCLSRGVALSEAHRAESLAESSGHTVKHSLASHADTLSGIAKIMNLPNSSISNHQNLLASTQKSHDFLISTCARHIQCTSPLLVFLQRI